ncbi:hypothetical protein BDW59DRAFT_16169 [Aspergillus cavernicola]|uniref:Shugoshin n=1 Tax=Aspergillus cavernicola TaxID=176166 RepID=A0ABR4HIZ3_9EURO
MARLNESTASAEPIEILKRRFVRQNREIARVNSIQSLRIRSLESEVSHLLSENVSLREQVITLTQDVERFEAAKTLHDGVYDVKGRLDSKLVELSSLVAELGNLPRRYSKATGQKDEPVVGRQPRQSSSINLANGADPEPSLGLEADGRLPVILEDKYYPRRTLEAQDLQRLLNNDTDDPSSPKLEESATSPEQSNEYEEPQMTGPTDVMDTNALGDYTEDENSLPPNLETRRKKKVGSARASEEQAYAEPTSLLDSKFIRKCGAKRKFSVEDEESFFDCGPAEDDGFKFNRPVHSPVKLSSQIDDPSPIIRKPQPKVEISHGQPKRKVLEPKNANVNILSPTKPSVTKSYDQLQNPVTLGRNENSYPTQGKGGRTHRKNGSPQKPSISIYGNETSVNNDEIETKADLVTDAPPPQDADHEVPAAADTLITRPSRRQRAVVSYAEPSLRDKMRRSTNDLGPAVGDRSRNSNSYTDANLEQNEQKGRNSPTKNARSITNGGQALFDNEPLEGNPKRQMDMISQRKRKTSGQLVDDCGEDPAGRQSRRIKASDGRIEEGLEDQIAASIPQDNPQSFVSSGQDISADMDQAASDTSRKSRRYSSNTRSSGRSIAPRFSTSLLNVEAEGDDLATAYPGGSMDELSLRSTNGDEYPARELQEYSDKSFLMGSREMSRGQRVAARRRSMMI